MIDMKEKKVKTLFKCEHCVSFYEVKSRAVRCATKDLKNISERTGKPFVKGSIIITKYVGDLTRVSDRQNRTHFKKDKQPDKSLKGK